MKASQPSVDQDHSKGFPTCHSAHQGHSEHRLSRQGSGERRDVWMDRCGGVQVCVCVSGVVYVYRRMLERVTVKKIGRAHV